MGPDRRGGVELWGHNMGLMEEERWEAEVLMLGETNLGPNEKLLGKFWSCLGSVCPMKLNQ